MGQQVIQHTLAQQNHLHVQRNWLRLLADRGRQPIQTLQRFNPDFTGEQNTLQALPGQRLGKNAAGVQNQVATVGPMKGASANQSEIGIQVTLASPVFDLTAQVLMVGQVFIHHGGTPGVGVVDQQVHAVPVQ